MLLLAAAAAGGAAVAAAAAAAAEAAAAEAAAATQPPLGLSSVNWPDSAVSPTAATTREVGPYMYLSPRHTMHVEPSCFTSL
jgi:hypothetical protein